MHNVRSIRSLENQEHNATAPMRYDIIVIGASMGGFHALRQIISEFPANLPAAVFVVLHIPADHESFLATSWGRNAKLPVMSAIDGAHIKPGHVYVAVPDFHLRVDGARITLDHGPKHNFHRPAVDTLFTSAAEAFGPRVVGVVLTGALDDGTSGLMDIKRHGGRSVVQTPSDAANPSMPASALDCVPMDHCVPLSEMGLLLSGLAGRVVDQDFVRKGKRMQKPSGPELSTHICPECNGPMWLVETGKLLHFHCRIGHSFSGQSLLVEKTMALESALWSAVNALKDKADISKKLAMRARGNSPAGSDVDYFLSQAANSESHARVISEIVLKEKSPTALASKKPTRKKRAKATKKPKAA
jgi:two-component system chemotaxis response regulator CheB